MILTKNLDSTGQFHCFSKYGLFSLTVSIYNHGKGKVFKT